LTHNNSPDEWRRRPDEQRRQDEQLRHATEATIRAMSLPSTGATAARMATIISSLW
jgi:hypothetical protein